MVWIYSEKRILFANINDLPDINDLNSQLFHVIDLEHQHVRYNPLKGEWILVSPHRLQRPWSGQVESTDEVEIPRFDPNNPLCPGACRPNGATNPEYTSTFVFNNDFPSLLPDCPEGDGGKFDELFRFEPARGTCRVMCFHPHSDVTIPLMSPAEIVAVIEKYFTFYAFFSKNWTNVEIPCFARWIEQLIELGAKYNWVQIFENKGSIMGCSNPHPHCQIWASTFIPNEGRIKDIHQREYFEKHGRPMLLDYVNAEIEKKVTKLTKLTSAIDYWFGGSNLINKQVAIRGYTCNHISPEEGTQKWREKECHRTLKKFPK